MKFKSNSDESGFKDICHGVAYWASFILRKACVFQSLNLVPPFEQDVQERLAAGKLHTDGEYLVHWNQADHEEVITIVMVYHDISRVFLPIQWLKLFPISNRLEVPASIVFMRKKTKSPFMKFFLIPVMASVFAFLSTARCSADLILDVSGVPGTGITSWNFSGFDVAGAPEAFNFQQNKGPFDDDPLLSDSIFAQQGDMFKSTWNSVDNTTILEPVATPWNVTVTTPNGTRGIDELYLKDKGDGSTAESVDDIGFYIDGNSDLSFITNDTVSWTGSMDLSIDINDMNVGSYNFDYFAFIFGTLELTVNISEATAVPEPSAVTFLTLSGLAIWTRRRKRPRVSPNQR